MTDEEQYYNKLKTSSLSELIEELEWFWCDPYYNDMWIAVIEELRKRLGVEREE